MYDGPAVATSKSITSSTSSSRSRHPRHLQPHLRPGLGLDPLVRRLARRHEQHPLEPKLRSRLLGQHEVTDVGRVERAPEDPERS